jgi:hypothetical protein
MGTPSNRPGSVERKRITEHDEGAAMQDDDDDPLVEALIEYVDTLPEAQQGTIGARLQQEESFFVAMSGALEETTRLISAAAVLDDADFEPLRTAFLERTHADIPEVRTLRTYFLNKDPSSEIPDLLDSKAKKQRFEQRRSALARAYEKSLG